MLTFLCLPQAMVTFSPMKMHCYEESKQECLVWWWQGTVCQMFCLFIPATYNYFFSLFQLCIETFFLVNKQPKKLPHYCKSNFIWFRCNLHFLIQHDFKYLINGIDLEEHCAGKIHNLRSGQWFLHLREKSAAWYRVRLILSLSQTLGDDFLWNLWRESYLCM